jgi:hypothetical protein
MGNLAATFHLNEKKHMMQCVAWWNARYDVSWNDVVHYCDLQNMSLYDTILFCDRSIMYIFIYIYYIDIIYIDMYIYICI